MDIYNISNRLLSMIVENLDANYNNQELEKKKILELLTGKTKFNRVLKSNLMNTELTEEELRTVLILIITSKAYLYENYVCLKQIPPEGTIEQIKGMIDSLENMDYRDIITSFYDNDEIAYLLIDDFLGYYDLTYVGKSQCKEYVFNDKEKIKCLLKLNPFEFFDISHFIGNKELLQSEIIIQDFFDIYEGRFNFVDNESGDEDSQQTDEEDEELYAQFLEILMNKYPEDYVNNFLLYMCGNVYESLTSKSKDYKSNEELLNYFYENDVNQILNDIKNNYSFASIIVNYFYESNAHISREELSRRRRKFKKKNKDFSKIKDLNPFFDREEELFTRKKINHHD